MLQTEFVTILLRMWPTQPLVQLVPGLFLEGKTAGSWRSTHFSVASRLKKGYSHTSPQRRIKLFGAPRQWKNFRPLFQAVFLSGGGVIPPDWVKHHASQSQEITNILFYILNLWLRICCSGLRGCDTREKEIVIWPCWCFMADIIFTLLSLLLCL